MHTFLMNPNATQELWSALLAFVLNCGIAAFFGAISFFWSSVHRILMCCETVLALMASFMISFFFVVILLICSYGSFAFLLTNPGLNTALAFSLIVSGTILAIYSFCWYAHLVNPERIYSGQNFFHKITSVNAKPYAIEIACNVPRMSRFISIILSIWWLIHFGCGVVIVYGVDLWIQKVFIRPTAITRFVWSQSIGFAFGLAMNMYLLLSVAIYAKKPDTLSRFWRLRYFIDLLVPLGATIPIALGLLK